MAAQTEFNRHRAGPCRCSRQGRWVWVARGVEPSSSSDALPAPVQPYPPAASKRPHPPRSFSVTHPGGRGRSTNCFAHAVLVTCSACSLRESVTGTWAARYWPPYRGTFGRQTLTLVPALRRHHTNSVPSIVHARPSLLCSLAPCLFASHGLRYSAFQIPQRHPPSNHRLQNALSPRLPLKKPATRSAPVGALLEKQPMHGWRHGIGRALT